MGYHSSAVLAPLINVLIGKAMAAVKVHSLSESMPAAVLQSCRRTLFNSFWQSCKQTLLYSNVVVVQAKPSLQLHYCLYLVVLIMCCEVCHNASCTASNPCFVFVCPAGMCLQDGAYGALAAPHHRRLLMVTQQLQPAAAAAVTIAAAMTMLLVAAVMCLRWRRRFLQQQPQQQQDKDLQHKKVQQACNSSHSKCSGSLTKQQQQQCGECVSAASRHCSTRGCSPSSAPAATSAAAAADASKDSVQLTVLPLGPEAYNYSRATGTRSKMQHRLPCIASDRSTSSSGMSDSAASIEAALVASQGNDAAAVAAAASSSAAAASSASAVSNSTDSLGPLTSMLTEANLLRCVTPDNDNGCYNSHVIFIPDSQLGNLSPEAAAAAAAASSSAQHDALMRQLHGSAASSASGSTQLRGVNAALFRLEASEEDARGMPAVVLGTLSRAQAAAIKFGESCVCHAAVCCYCTERS
jgi:hypothetical protein